MKSDYEKCREEIIKQNLERMQKLGIYDLSLKLKPIRFKNNQNKTPNSCVLPLPSILPTRRSSRLQNIPVANYRPEVYTEEHEKMLGDTKTEWTLFVDGYGIDGKRISDQVRGKYCHQCRKKTLGCRTHCIRCNRFQGQICGDCLYMRYIPHFPFALNRKLYGENILEAMQNPDWSCPGCRGICNCCVCRRAKGWAPTGMIYEKISSLGYKSVAHYLIQTRRSDPDSEKNEEDERPTGLESLDEDGVATNEELEEFESEDAIVTKKANEDEKRTELESSDEPLCNNVKLENINESKSKNPEFEVDENKNKVNESEGDLEIINPEYKDNNRNADDFKTNIVTPETKKGSRKKRQIVVLDYSIAGRLRSRRKCT